MNGQMRLGEIDEAEFSRILQALSASVIGRAFLLEYRRRTRPQETCDLLDALGRIEGSLIGVRDQLQPERLADELRHVAMALEIAVEGAASDSDGMPGRMMLVARARTDLLTLAESLAGRTGPELQGPAERASEAGR